LCFKFVHTSFFQPIPKDPEPSILGPPFAVSDPLWYPDTGATHHIMHNSAAFSKKQNYTCTDIVQLGNGSDMPIHNVGSASLCKISFNHFFTLNNFLHVPSVNKNILSVSLFAHDNGFSLNSSLTIPM